MCSQFDSPSIAKIVKYARSVPAIPGQHANSDVHIYPYADAPVIIKESGQSEIVLMSYSLIPHWSKVPKPKFSTYNARLDRIGSNNKLELIYDLPTWKIPFKRHHCIVPIVGFYESCHFGSHVGNIVRFSSITPEEILFAAGIWDEWVDNSTGEIIHSFAIITDEPTPFILSIGHDRQPVFMGLQDAEAWLNNETQDSAKLYSFLKAHQIPIDYQVSNYKQLKGFKNDLPG